MYIKEIKDYDIDALEADIIVTDGQYEIMCYAQPFGNKEKKSFKLFAFDCSDVMRAIENKYMINKDVESYYGYSLQGKLFDMEKRLVSIGKIIIELEDIIPKDIKQNEFIEFKVLRIDLIEI